MKVKNYILYTLTALVSMLVSCSENLFEPTNGNGKEVTLTLSYADDTPEQVVLTRATEAEERHLDNLYIYIFDSYGRLKGFKAIEGEANLEQSTNDTNRGTVSVKTLAGDAYIFAVANINTGLYPVATGHSDGQLPIDFSEDDVQDGLETEFTLKKFLNLPFIRNNSNTLQISSAFLMSGSVNDGKLVSISSAGAVVSGNSDANVIKLRRVVSKVRFNIGVKSGDGVTRSFTAQRYTICNAAMQGPLISGRQSTSNTVFIPTLADSNYSDIQANFSNQNVDSQGRSYFEVYVPANEQTAKQTLPSGSTYANREDDLQTDPKVFTYAPQYGTFVAIEGLYIENSTSGKYVAETTYFVHLGDFSDDLNNYDVLRNYAYTYNITVAGVNKIIIEAEKQGNDQPGAEGLVLNISTGRDFSLDSHYEYCVMRFYQSKVLDLMAEGCSYMFQVSDVTGKTDVCYYTSDGLVGEKNGEDWTWIEFVKGGTYSTSTNAGRGTPIAYPGKGSSSIYHIDDLIELLYKNANNNSFWTGNGNNKYVDFTCFLDENYYPDLTWDKYTNSVSNRILYIADEIEVSTDTRSSYADVCYAVHQYPIQTVYNPNKASSIVAYGCETINDEEELGTNNNYSASNSNYQQYKTNPRYQFYQNLRYSNTTWSSLSSNSQLNKACYSRNRDLDGDGIIDENEIRWYTPNLTQMAGLWFGEEVILSKSRLYNGSTSNLTYGSNNYRKVYFTSDQNAVAYFSEEGMATGTSTTGEWMPHYLKCVRTLKSNDDGSGYSQVPDEYYTYTSSTNLVDMSNFASQALNVTGDQGELQSHSERDEADKIALRFTIADSNLTTYTTSTGTWRPSYQTNNFNVSDVVNGTVTCAKYYSQDNKTWRVPNHRELMLETLILGNSSMANCVSKTLFSNQSFRYTWRINSNNIQLLDPVSNGTSSLTSYIRCISVEQ